MPFVAQTFRIHDWSAVQQPGAARFNGNSGAVPTLRRGRQRERSPSRTSTPRPESQPRGERGNQISFWTCEPPSKWKLLAASDAACAGTAAPAPDRAAAWRLRSPAAHPHTRRATCVSSMTSRSTACSRASWISPSSHQIAGWNQKTQRTNSSATVNSQSRRSHVQQFVAQDGLLRGRVQLREAAPAGGSPGRRTPKVTGLEISSENPQVGAAHAPATLRPSKRRANGGAGGAVARSPTASQPNRHSAPPASTRERDLGPTESPSAAGCAGCTATMVRRSTLHSVPRSLPASTAGQRAAAGRRPAGSARRPAGARASAAAARGHECRQRRPAARSACCR